MGNSNADLQSNFMGKCEGRKNVEKTNNFLERKVSGICK